MRDAGPKACIGRSKIPGIRLLSLTGAATAK